MLYFKSVLNGCMIKCYVSISVIFCDSYFEECLGSDFFDTVKNVSEMFQENCPEAEKEFSFAGFFSLVPAAAGYG